MVSARTKRVIPRGELLASKGVSKLVVVELLRDSAFGGVEIQRTDDDGVQRR